MSAIAGRRPPRTAGRSCARGDRRAGHIVLAALLIVYPARRLRFLHRPDRRLFADPRHDRAVADAARRLWRHGQPGADHASPASPAMRSRSSALNNTGVHRLRLAVVGRWCRSPIAGRGRRLGADRLDLGPHRAGIYTIMITLAIATAFFYFAQQNYSLFNGHSGFAGIAAAARSGASTGAIPGPFYYLCLAVAAAWPMPPCSTSRARPSGWRCRRPATIPRRMRALGFDVTAAQGRRLFPVPGSSPASAGVLLVWFNGRISPGTIGVDAAIDVLVIAVDRRHAPSDRAVHRRGSSSCCCKTFAIDIVGRGAVQHADRRSCFLAIVFVSPDGLLGLVAELKPHLAPGVACARCVDSGASSVARFSQPREGNE